MPKLDKIGNDHVQKASRRAKSIKVMRLFSRFNTSMAMFLAIVATVLVSCTAEQKNNYYISGTTPADDSSKVVYLKVYKDTTTLDSAIVENHQFTFEGYTERPIMVTVNNGDPHNGWRLFLEADSLTLVDTLYYATGGKLNQEYIKFEEETEAFPDDVSADVFAQFIKKNWANHTDDALGAYMLSIGYSYMNIKDIESLTSMAGENIKDDVLFKMVTTNLALQKKTSEGQMFTDANLKDLDGKDRKLSEIVGKGKYVVMDCWASWCPPCRKLIPELKKIYSSYKDKGFEVIGVATRDEVEDTKKAVEELSIPWTIMTDADLDVTIRDVYGFEGIPFVIMFDPDGKIIARNIGEEEILDILSRQQR